MKFLKHSLLLSLFLLANAPGLWAQLAIIGVEEFINGIPPTWTVINSPAGATNGWEDTTIVTPNPVFMPTVYDLVSADNQFVIAQSDEFSPTFTELITPPLDFSGTDSVVLEFSHYAHLPTGVGHIEVGFSIGGSPFQMVYSSDMTTGRIEVVDFTAMVAFNEDVRFRFLFDVPALVPPDNAFWVLDYAKIKGGLVESEFDLALRGKKKGSSGPKDAQIDSCLLAEFEAYLSVPIGSCAFDDVLNNRGPVRGVIKDMSGAVVTTISFPIASVELLEVGQTDTLESSHVFDSPGVYKIEYQFFNYIGDCDSSNDYDSEWFYVGCCDDLPFKLLFENTDALPIFSQVSDSIALGQSVDPTTLDGPVTVDGGDPAAGLAPDTVTMRAGRQILLTDGFTAQAGSRFCAQIEPCRERPCILVNIKMLLEGAYDLAGGKMDTLLAANGLLPLEQPYHQAPWNYLGNETLENQSDIPTNAVDWVMVELRDGLDDMVIIDTAAALLLSNGLLQSVNGANGVKFYDAAVGDYYLVVRHRNHLAVMSAMPVTLPNPIAYDFTTSPQQASGTDQLSELATGVFALHAGDINADGAVTVADFNIYSTEAAGLNGYFVSDVNVDKNVTVADFNLYLPNAGKIGVSQVRY